MGSLNAQLFAAWVITRRTQPAPIVFTQFETPPGTGPLELAAQCPPLLPHPCLASTVAEFPPAPGEAVAAATSYTQRCDL